MRGKIALSCEACGERNYMTTNKKTNEAKRLELKKFCKVCNTHTIHKETK